ncbi:hypothetical protein U0X36_29460 [Bacillus thuringiensis]|uniref:IS1096 element passenger TnpR family protein n=1 Tax=Bacillus thuringiensis TaxID=1428 RepID=UPI000E4AA198|nr:hypothetical protein [Bacillus thuringiensis]MDZ3956912.1 hypothetical protein [Bacillus thuringiensis]RGP42347.1 hypothetical protein BTW32_31270 [Bacillus thuringiensis]
MNQKHCQLYMIVEGFRPAVWREIIIPADLIFGELHIVISQVFEWSKEADYLFKVGKYEIVDRKNLNLPMGENKVDGTQSVETYFFSHKVLTYWRNTSPRVKVNIIIQKIHQTSSHNMVCLAGENKVCVKDNMVEVPITEIVEKNGLEVHSQIEKSQVYCVDKNKLNQSLLIGGLQ